jgi:exonuclease SbcD
MKATFAHLADIHLGNTQYGLSDRFDDFGRAWDDAIRQIIARKVDFVVLAGDLFEKRSVEPLALIQAQDGLRRLRQAGIPVVAVEGNHDAALYRDGFSWMEYLDRQGELKLLDPCQAGESGYHYRPHQKGGGGCYVDFGGVRVVGQPYLGASAARAIEEMTARLRLDGTGEAQYVVYVAHAGLEGIVARAPGCLAEAELAPLRPRIDYVALGHIHQHFERDGWLFNPGSLETCRSDESEAPSGFFIVEVDTDAPEKHRTTLLSNWRRLFVRLSFGLDGLSDMASVVSALGPYLGERALPFAGGDEPVVDLKLTGRLGFDPATLDLEAVRTLVRATFDALHVEVRDLAQRPGSAAVEGEDETREEIEYRVLADAFAGNARYAAQSEGWARLTGTLKQMALSGSDPASLVAALTEGAATLDSLLPITECAPKETAHASA